MDNLNASDCTPDMFPEYRQAHMGNLVPGMKLEAVDPLNLATICVATVMKVLRYGYYNYLVCRVFSQVKCVKNYANQLFNMSKFTLQNIIFVLFTSLMADPRQNLIRVCC